MSKLEKRLGKYGEWAMVAGSAEGLGLAFADTLGSLRKNLIMVDNDREKLHRSATAIAARHKVEVRIIETNLAHPEAVDELMQEITLKSCRLVIYNAAYGPVRQFCNNTPEQLDLYLDLNCRTLLHLAHRFTRHFQDRSNAGFLVMSSMAGLRGTMLVSPYAATKAFAWNLAESLYYEFRSNGVDFTAACAGAIATPGFLSTNPRKTFLSPRPRDPGFVAMKALGALGRYTRYIPGTSEQISHFILSRCLPRKWAGNLVNRVIVKMYHESGRSSNFN